MSTPPPTPVVLRLELPFYGKQIPPVGATETLTAFPYARIMDDQWAEAINAALRSSIEVQFDSIELRR